MTKRLASIFSLTALLAAALFTQAPAAGFSFDAPSQPLLSAAEFSVAAPLTAPLPAAQLRGPRAYDFKALWKSLGYPAVDGQDGGEAVAAFGATEDEVMDLTSYTSKSDPFYEEVNGFLRFFPAPYDWSGTSPEIARGMVKNIDKVLTRVPAIPAEVALFRGLDLKFRDSRPYAAGEEFIDKGYVSTSVSYKVARYFAIEMNDNATTPSRKAIFALYLTRPEQGILIRQGEDEVILGHGRKFRVMAKKDNVAKYDLYLVQVCGRTCDTEVNSGAAAFWSNLSVQD